MCVECKNVFRFRGSSGTAQYRRYYSVSQDLCTPCFCDANIKTAKMTKYQAIICFIPMVVLMVFFFGFFGFFSFSSSIMVFMMLPIIVMIIAFGVIMIVMMRSATLSPKKKAEFQMRKQNFLNSVSMPSGVPASVSAPINGSISTPAYCQQCGADLDPNEKFCSQCGSEIK